MGMMDRDYTQREQENSGPLAQLTPVVKWLLILNISIYLLDTLLKGNLANGPLRSFGAFTIQSAIFEGKIWEFITFQFMHGFFGHVLFNCLGLFFFGPFMERWWGSQKFIIYYLLSGIGGAVFYALLMAIGVLRDSDAQSALVGASAGIYGILVGVAMSAPNMRVRLLFPPIELSMRQLAIAMLAISVVMIVLPFGLNQGGEAGHLGGAIFGFLMMRFPQWLGATGGARIAFPRAFSKRPEPKIRPRSEVLKSQSDELDRILDKISAKGFQSLTEAERATLQKVSDSHKSQS